MKRGVKFGRFVQFVKFGGPAAALVGLLLMLGHARAQDDQPAEEGVRFVPVEVVVDSGKAGLGAYQVEVTAPAGVEIVGLEGGESVFKDAPYYDPAARMGRRIVVAAFSLDEKLPRGEVSVARLHLQVRGAGDVVGRLDKKLVVATDADGKTISASVKLRAFEGDAK